jgi:hypothetical protein
MQELIRRVDPQHRSLGGFFADEIARPLGLDFFIGLPEQIPADRLASVKPLSGARALAAICATPLDLIPKVLWPWSLLRKSLAFVNLPWNERALPPPRAGSHLRFESARIRCARRTWDRHAPFRLVCRAGLGPHRLRRGLRQRVRRARHPRRTQGSPRREDDRDSASHVIDGWSSLLAQSLRGLPLERTSCGPVDALLRVAPC